MPRRRLAALLAEAALADRDVQMERARADRDSGNFRTATQALASFLPAAAELGGKAIDAADARELAEAEAFAAQHGAEPGKRGPDGAYLEDPSVAARMIMGRYKAPEPEAPPKAWHEDALDRLTGGPGRRKRAAELAAGKLAPAIADRRDAEAKRALEAQRTAAERDAAQQRTAASAADAARKAQEDTRKADEEARKAGKARLRSIVASAKTIDAARDAAASDPTTGMFNDDDVDAAWSDYRAEVAARDAAVDDKRASAERKRRAPRIDPVKAATARVRLAILQRKLGEPSATELKGAEALAVADRRLVNLEEIGGLKAQFNTGPVGSRWLDFREAIGVPEDGWVTFKALLVAEMNEYIKEMTGASAGVEEMKRLISVKPHPSQDDEAFMEKYDLFMKHARAARESVARIHAPRTAGAAPALPESFDVMELEALED